jgi:hypothetical protein
MMGSPQRHRVHRELQVLFSFAGERPANEKPSAAARQAETNHPLPQASCFLSGRLSRPVKKRSFLRDLCASVVNILSSQQLAAFTQAIVPVLNEYLPK